MAGMSAFETIDEYIASYPRDVGMLLQQMRKTIQKAAPEAEEAMRYGLPTFRMNGKNLVHFGAYKTHIGFYPTPAGITAFKKELKPYKTSKGAVQFPLDEKLPLGLVGRVVRFRKKMLA